MLDSARTLNGSNKIFLSLHMLQKGEGALTPKVGLILTFTSGKQCGISTSVMCRQPGYPGRVSHAAWALVWSQSQDISAYLQLFCVGKDHIGCGQCNDIICTCWHSPRLAFDHGQLALDLKKTFSCSFLISSYKRYHFRFYPRRGAHRRQHICHS